MQVMIIGHPQAVLGFSLAGVDGQAATTAEEVNQALEIAFSTPEIGIVLVTEDAASLIGEKMDQLRLRSTIPLVVEIPGPDAPQSQRPTLNEVVFRAIGIKI
jgi:V/A-type H+/Na+-transporting ATPase subunit F